ncbi:MAG: phage baseplate assembly protein V [Persicimonas sp.]
MYRRGIVTAVDPERCRARVELADEGVETHWLDVLQSNTAPNQDYRLPDEGELVAVMLDEHAEAGCILGAIYTSENKPPDPSADVRRVTFPDGTKIEYDRAASRLTIVCAGDVSVTGPNVQLDATVQVAGGAEAVALAQKVTDALQQLKDAIANGVPAPQDGGAALQQSIVLALSAFPPDVASEKLSSD